MPRDYLQGRSEAHEINQRLTVAYYLDSAGETESAEYHYSLALKEFHLLAAALGFKVERVASDERSHGSPMFRNRPGLDLVLGDSI